MGVVIGTDQAYNSILLAEDEARMLGRAAVEPEHLLLALARQVSLESLLSRRGVTSRDIHAALIRARGSRHFLMITWPIAGCVPVERAAVRSELELERGTLSPYATRSCAG